MLISADDAHEADALVDVGDAQSGLSARGRLFHHGVGDGELGEEAEVVETRELGEGQLAAVAVGAGGQAVDPLDHGPGARREADGSVVHAERGQVEGDGRTSDAAGGRSPETLGLELLERAGVVVVELDELPAGLAYGRARDGLAVRPAGVVGDGGGVDTHG